MKVRSKTTQLNVCRLLLPEVWLQLQEPRTYTSAQQRLFCRLLLPMSDKTEMLDV